jgi:hypothetical protein
MLFRAIFAFGLVFVLMPHEPNVGFGRPHSDGSTSGWLPPARSGICHNDQTFCISDGFLESVRTFTVRSLAAVKLDIAESQRERIMRTHTL